MKILLNADLGERGVDHPVDLALLPLLDIANIAAGGHAGDAESAAAFAALSQEQNVIASAHLSYPDRANFGRAPLDLPLHDLLSALDRQRACLPETSWLKFHGALYLKAAHDKALAEALATWASASAFTHMLCLPDSALAEASSNVGMRVVREFFVERRYTRTKDGHITLLPRSHAKHSIAIAEEAQQQGQQWLHTGMVDLVETPETASTLLSAESICIHSDSPIALELAQSLRRMLDA